MSEKKSPPEDAALTAVPTGSALAAVPTGSALAAGPTTTTASTAMSTYEILTQLEGGKTKNAQNNHILVEGNLIILSTILPQEVC